MKITRIELANVRGFRSLPKTELAENINILVGPNNSGKSTILHSIYRLQRPGILNANDSTLGTSNGDIMLSFTGSHKGFIANHKLNDRLYMRLNTKQIVLHYKNDNHQNLPKPVAEKEPYNLIYPYFSKRKTVSFEVTINETNTTSVTGNLTNLYSKIDRLTTPQFQPANSQYVKACNDILGFEIATLAKGNGKQAVLFIHNQEHIPLTAMGEGVTNMLGLITDLCVAENRIFLIEEPENDIHPNALKALLDLIAEKSKSNQFFISTHSNIVMKKLGAVENAKVFEVTNKEFDEEKPKLALSSVTEISNDPNERKRVLEDLGYDFFDFDLWKGWLFLEESSAEIIIRDHLIRWFVPELKNKLRTFSAGSTSRIEPKFEDFNSLFVFLHLEPTYKNKVWVIIDSGENEKEIIERLKKKYLGSGWSEDNFRQFDFHDFEECYPEQFQEKVKEALDIKDKKKKRLAKRELLEEVKDWISENEEDAKKAFKESTSDIISKLKAIEKEL
ncbi:MAG: AAA family ATPase [Crocinitomicaceae bacterium]